MNAASRLCHTLVLALSVVSAYAQSAPPLRVVVDSSTELPFASIERPYGQGERLSGGIHFDLGHAIARAMGRSPEFLVLPRKRVTAALIEGHADVMCAYQPGWLPGDFAWSVPFLPSAEVIAVSNRVERPDRLGALKGQKIGTVLGFTYPGVEKAIGGTFVRDDAPNAESNLRKIAMGRFNYALFNKLYLDYKLNDRDLASHLHPYIVVYPYKSQCAVSKRGTVSVSALNRALQLLAKGGDVQRILDAYRPSATASNSQGGALH